MVRIPSSSWILLATKRATDSVAAADPMVTGSDPSSYKMIGLNCPVTNFSRITTSGMIVFNGNPPVPVLRLCFHGNSRKMKIGEWKRGQRSRGRKEARRREEEGVGKKVAISNLCFIIIH